MLDIYHYQEIFMKLGMAVFVGGFIGLERDLKNKPAGIRTNILICVGACLVMMISEDLARKVSREMVSVDGTMTRIVGDPGRLAAQVISGIGFLGAGAILQSQGKGVIIGMTTAATIWTNAAIGLTIGSGYYFLAFCAFIVTMVTLLLAGFFRFLPVGNRPRMRRLIVILKKHHQVEQLKHYFAAHRVAVETEEFKKRIEDFEYRADLLISPNAESVMTESLNADGNILSFHLAEPL
jgi:putative Mg2+ transporter-C (MgtC) family protein